MDKYITFQEDAREFARENSWCPRAIPLKFRKHISKELLGKRNLILVLIVSHMLVIIGLLAASGARRAYLALIANIGYMFILSLGLAVFTLV